MEPYNTALTKLNGIVTLADLLYTNAMRRRPWRRKAIQQRRNDARYDMDALEQLVIDVEEIVKSLRGEALVVETFMATPVTDQFEYLNDESEIEVTYAAVRAEQQRRIAAAAAEVGTDVHQEVT